MAENVGTPRRSSRLKTLNRTGSVKKSKQESLKDEGIEHISQHIQKPVELFDKKHVNSENIYGFQTPCKKDMVQKAKSCSTSTIRNTSNVFKVSPKTNVTPSGSTNYNNVKKTTDRVKNTDIRALESSLTSNDSESVSEDSEYQPSTDQSEIELEHEISEHSDFSNDGEDDREGKIYIKTPQHKIKHQSRLMSTPRRLQSKFKAAYKDYHIETDEYFETQSQKVTTSNHTLSQLRNSHFTQERLQELLSSQSHITKAHRKGIWSLSQNYHELFPLWHFMMEEGYTLLLHGLGSKRNLINDFHKEVIVDHPTLIVNGFFPSLTIKDILDNLITDLLELYAPANPNDCVDLIHKILVKNPDDRLYLLIHNIDGIMLRSNKSQNVLSSLAKIPNLHMMASVDHVNSPLLWDHVKHSRYNFCWWDATTLLPYDAETSYEGSLMIQQSGTLALSSLHNVFLSLTSNARTIYILLVKYQLKNSNGAHYPGMAFKDLYRAAREGFLVSTDLALRAQLTEFIDHKLVRTKRNVDGVEYLIIPLSNELLKQFLEQHDS